MRVGRVLSQKILPPPYKNYPVPGSSFQLRSPDAYGSNNCAVIIGFVIGCCDTIRVAFT